MIKRLQVLQSVAARILHKIPKQQSASPALATLHWLPVQRRIPFKALCIAHRSIHGKGTIIIQKLFTPYVPRRPLRSGKLGLLTVPKVNSARGGSRSFEYLVPKLWNTLPAAIRYQQSEASFIKLLKTHLF